MLRQLVIFGLLSAGTSAFACEVSSAKITGTIGGSRMDNGRCIVTVEIEKATPHRVCPLFLKAGQTIEIATALSNDDCPQDEGPVSGVVSTSGTKILNFSNGQVDGHQL